jgi:hypothetical protein
MTFVPTFVLAGASLIVSSLVSECRDWVDVEKNPCRKVDIAITTVGVSGQYDPINVLCLDWYLYIKMRACYWSRHYEEKFTVLPWHFFPAWQMSLRRLLTITQNSWDVHSAILRGT